MARPDHRGTQEDDCAHLCMGQRRRPPAAIRYAAGKLPVAPRLDGGFRLGVSVGKVLLFGRVARVNPPAGQVDSHRLPFLQPERSFFGDGLEFDLDQRLQISGHTGKFVQPAVTGQTLARFRGRRT